MTLPGHHNERGGVAFSPDSRYLASVGDGWNQPNNPQTIQVFEVLTGKEVHRFEPHEPVLAVAFSPDGRRLVTGGTDTTALIWDLENLTGAAHPAAVPDEDLEKYWEALADSDAAQAYRAQTALVHAPKKATDLLSQKLQPAPGTDGEKLKQLIADLDDQNFEKRQRAQKALADLGDLAEPALRAALKRAPSLEVRRRVETLLEQIKPIPRTRPAQLRELRCVGILERIDTPEARTLLERLARGNPHSELTREVVRTLRSRK